MGWTKYLMCVYIGKMWHEPLCKWSAMWSGRVGEEGCFEVVWAHRENEE